MGISKRLLVLAIYERPVRFVGEAGGKEAEGERLEAGGRGPGAGEN